MCIPSLCVNRYLWNVLFDPCLWILQKLIYVAIHCCYSSARVLSRAFCQASRQSSLHLWDWVWSRTTVKRLKIYLTHLWFTWLIFNTVLGWLQWGASQLCCKCAKLWMVKAGVKPQEKFFVSQIIYVYAWCSFVERFIFCSITVT